jgi:DNA modification methylase
MTGTSDGRGYARTELVWPGKRRQVEKVALPFQRVESINRPRGADMFSGLAGADGWRNKLIWGDNKLVMGSLLAGDPSSGIESLAGKIDLIYIDPPFDTGADFSFRTQIGGEECAKEPSAIEQLAYRDTWSAGTESYLQMIYARLVLARSLLRPGGSIYVHLGPNVHPFVHCIMDEIFGQGVSGDIIWKRTTTHSDSKWWGVANDVICFHTFGESFTYNKQAMPYSDSYIDSHYSSTDGDGRAYTADNLTAAGLRNGASGRAWRGFDPNPKGIHWKYTVDKLDELDRQGRIYWPKSGGWPRYKRYLDEMPGVIVGNIWSDIPAVNSQAKEDTQYDTQKPEALLERIINASSNEGDLVADFFVGSGTTAAVAQRLGRRWIACDLGRFAVHTTRKRLLDAGATFDVLNLGKYERAVWQGATLPDGLRADVDVVLRLYRAEPVHDDKHLHGVKAGRAVHVGAVDAPVTFDEIDAVLAECRATHTSRVDVLGWEWEFSLNEQAQQRAAGQGVDLRLHQIPSEVMDPRAKAADVTFYSLAYMELEPRISGLGVSVALKDFIIPDLDLIPAAVRNTVTSWSDYIDYWAIDFDSRDGVFRNDWQSFRTRKRRALDLGSPTHEYAAPGEYTITVKVVDVFGIDATKQLSVTV